MTGYLRASGDEITRAAVACLAALLAMIPANATSGALQVDFSEALARAMKNNPFMSAAGEEWTAAKMDAKIARSHYLPNLKFEERFARTSVPAEVFAFKINQERLLQSDFASVDNFNRPPPTNDYMTSFTVEQALFAPKAYFGYKIADREAGAKKEEDRKSTRLNSSHNPASRMPSSA
jgi:outer membrane protein TolC